MVPECVALNDAALTAHCLASERDGHSLPALAKAVFDAAVTCYADNVVAFVLARNATFQKARSAASGAAPRRRAMRTRYLVDNALRSDVGPARVERCLRLLYDDAHIDLGSVKWSADHAQLLADARFVRWTTDERSGGVESARALPEQSLFYVLHAAVDLLPVGEPGLLAKLESILYWVLMASQRQGGAAGGVLHRWLERPEYARRRDTGRAHFRCMWRLAHEARSPRLVDLVVRDFAAEHLHFEQPPQTRLAYLLPCFRTKQLASPVAAGLLQDLLALTPTTGVDAALAEMIAHAHWAHERVVLANAARFLDYGYARALGALLDARRPARRDHVLHALLTDDNVARLRGITRRLFANRLLVSLAIALRPLDLSLYVLEHIVLYLPPLADGLRHIERLQLIENVAKYRPAALRERDAGPPTRRVVPAVLTRLVADDSSARRYERKQSDDEYAADRCLALRADVLCNVCLRYRDVRGALITATRCVCLKCLRG